MSDLQIVGLGMSTLDVLMRLKDMPTWEHGTRISAFSFDGGGPVATAMAAAARLGARVGYIGTTGDDEAAAIKVRTLAKEGIHLEHLVVRPGPEKQIVLVFVDEETGERVFAGLGKFGAQPLRVEELDRDYITSAAYLHLDGMHTEAAIQAARWMHAAGKKVSLDGSKTSGPISPEMRALVTEVDVLICGQGFGKALTGKTDLWEAGEAALGMGLDVVVQTEGADGSYTVTAEEHFHIPAFSVPVVDTTGAGDVFHGAYLVGLLRGWSLRNVALFSTAVSALKCTKLGGRAGIPTFAETLAFLRERSMEIA
jgi:sulfofructose kinase